MTKHEKIILKKVAKIVIDVFKKCQLHFGSGDHGNRSISLFEGHNRCCNRQWLLTGRHFKCCSKFYVIYKTHFAALQQKKKSYRYIQHNSFERRSIFNASQWQKLSNVIGCFITCIGAYFPAFELDNAIRSRLPFGPLLGVSETCSTAPNSPAVLVNVSFKTYQAWSVSM